MDRRLFLASTLCAGLLPDTAWAAKTDTPLKKLAADKGVRYGTSTGTHALFGDPGYAAIVAQQAGMLVSEYQGKRAQLQPAPDRYDFAALDSIVAYAQRHGMAMRGHTLCWYSTNPPWLDAQMKSDLALPAKQKLLTDFVSTVAGRYRGRIAEWDVVNEPIEPGDGWPLGMRTRNNIWAVLTERYIDMAFHTARAADPSAALFLNEYGIEAATPWNERKRHALLLLLGRLKQRGVPIDGLGIQAHLRPYKDKFDQQVFATFLKQVTDMGLRISITEMDFSDRGGSNDPQQRDIDMAAAATAFLDVALDNPATRTVMSWGVTDRYSWLTSRFASDPWPKGGVARALPYDVNLKPKPLRTAIAQAFIDAAPRPRWRRGAA